MRLVISWNSRLWKDDLRITFVVASNPPVLVSYQTHSSEVVFVPFPENLEIEGSYNVGKWHVQSLYEVGNQRGIRGDLLTRSVQYALSVPVDGWMDKQGLDLLGYSNVQEIRESKDPSPYSLFRPLLSFGIDTNFSFFDRLQIARLLGGARSRRVVLPEQKRLVKQIRRLDGSLGYELDQERVKEMALREFRDTLLAQEQIGLGIINGTEKAGVGNSIAGVVSTMGSRVIWVRSEKVKIPIRCQLRATKEGQKTLIALRLATLLRCPLVSDSKASVPLELVIGEELAREVP